MTSRMLPTLLATLVALFALVAPSAAHAGSRGHGHGPPPGHVVVTNQSGGDVLVYLTGMPARVLPAWQTTDLHTAPGELTLRATYTQFGAERTLQYERLVVTPNRVVGVTLAPEDTARVLITNQSALYAQLLVDGRPGSAFKPGESRVVAMDAGRRDLVMTANGRTLSRTRMELRPFAEPRWRVEAPHTGFVTLDSDHWLGTEVRVDGRRMATLRPDGSQRIELALGWHEIDVRDDRGRIIHDTWVEVKPYDAALVTFGGRSHQRAYDGQAHEGHSSDGRSQDGHHDRDDRDDHRGHDHDGAVVAESCDLH